MIKKITARLHKKFRQKSKQDNTPEPQYVVFVDSPKKEVTNKDFVTVRGWLLPQGETKLKTLRIKNNTHYFPLPHGKKRLDVAKALADVDYEIALYSGFATRIKFTDGPMDIEADFGQGFQVIHSLKMIYSIDPLVDMIYEPDYGLFWAEHKNLLNNKKQYYYEDAVTENYQRHPDDPRLIAFYLPQFHPIKENDENWGKGFTEWTNVTTGEPRFVGHQQPILPKDHGFYDLRLPDSIKQQIELAKNRGIYGFCFYYYWFSGKKVLDKPLNIVLQNKQWDFNFCIAWANENWTKRWDGLDKEVILAQKYLTEDPLDFIKDVENILLDPRYIRENGKPVLIVYRPAHLQDPAHYAKVWRNYFKSQHKQELHLVAVMSFELGDPRKYGFDEGLDFAPLTTAINKHNFNNGKIPMVDIEGKLLDPDYVYVIMDYRKIALNKKIRKNYSFPSYRSVMPSWDNEARKKGKGGAFYRVTPDLYARWLDDMLAQETKKSNSRLFFINAWNEWAEGAMLEPSLHQGHAILNRTVEVVSKFSLNEINRKNFLPYSIRRNTHTKIAVVIHAFYKEEWSYIEKKLTALIDINYDLFVTINQKDKTLAQQIKRKHDNVTVLIVPNRGRDVLPFLFLTRRIAEAGYKYVLKLHTKKSLHRPDGKLWLEELTNALLPNTKVVQAIVKQLKERGGMVGPAGHFVSLNTYMGSNQGQIESILTQIYGKQATKKTSKNLNRTGYFAGTMFWARIDTLQPLLDLYLMPEDFEAERGQVDGTLAHAIERLFGLLPLLQGHMITTSSINGIKKIKAVDIQTKYKHAP